MPPTPISPASVSRSPRISSFLESPPRIIRTLLTDQRYYWHFVGLILAGEALICALLMRYRSYTNIDYVAYVQQARMFTKGERDYSQIRGDTGPLPYPALHLYIYTLLDKIFPYPSHLLMPKLTREDQLIHPQSPDVVYIRPLQVIFAGNYLATLSLVAWVCKMAGDAWIQVQSGREKKVDSKGEKIEEKPRNEWRRLLDVLELRPVTLQTLFPLLCLSTRLHSLYLLRFFNDTWTMLILYASVALLMKKRWKLGSVVYSLALGTKMNVLLYLPGLLVLLFQFQGIFNGLACIILMILVQILLPMPFFFETPALAKTYFSTAFDFGRHFDQQWSVNWQGISSTVFDSSRFHLALMVGHLTVLLLFAVFRWCGGPRGLVVTAARGVLGSWRRAPWTPGPGYAIHVPTVLFTSNLIGILFARSLHYQFYAWYAHTIPFLLWITGTSWMACSGIWITTSLVWNSYPPTANLSWLVIANHVVILILVARSEIQRRATRSALLATTMEDEQESVSGKSG